MSLVESEFSTPLPAGISFDLILCRNVMIYFAPDVSRRLIGQFHNVLECGGWLVVGSSDHNVKYYEAFCAVETTGAKIYQKAASARMRIAASVEEPPPSPAPMPRPPLIAHEPQGSMEGLRGLANRGEWQAAAEYACRLLSQDRLNPEIHFYQALILENQGIANESERSLRQAIYLDRSFALAHYHLGLVLKQDRKSRAAAKSFENVLKVLEGAPDNSIVTAGPGVTVIALKEFTRMHLETLAGAQL
jgi:chemotaxis protein methyltransferase CheR